MRLIVHDIAKAPVLAGRLFGRQLLTRLLEQANEPEEPAVCFLDFEGIEVATASFLRESMLTFRDVIRGRRSNLYPVIANASEEVTEELEELLKTRGDAILVCSLSTTEQTSNVRVLGDLDPKQLLTFKLVNECGGVDAGRLMRERSQNERVGQTAWNNRLASLVAKGLIFEDSLGRTKWYRPILEMGR